MKQSTDIGTMVHESLENYLNGKDWNNFTDDQNGTMAYKITNKFINGPINKSNFLDKKFLGMTEYISKKFNVKKNAMLIYNKELSVCPLTTHLPIKFVSKKISKSLILEKVILINNF